MNKNDFYKQLMSEYTFDVEKIKNNAKKGRFARQKISPFTIGLTASVAVATVACGTLAITMLDNKNGISLVDTGSKTLSELSAAERVKAAIEQQNKDKDNEDVKDVLVTFAAPTAPAAVESILSTYIEGNLYVKAIYTQDGSIITGDNQIASAFAGGQNVNAVVIKCAASVKAELQSNSNIFLVEDWNESDISTVNPIDPDEVETIDIQLPDNIEENVTPDTSVPIIDVPDTDIGNTVGGEPSLPTESEPESIESETVDTNSTVEADTPDETIDVPSTSETVDTSSDNEDGSASETPESNVHPDEPVVSAPVLPEGVVLPTEPDSVLYETDIIDSKNAFFLSENVFYVKTNKTISLYEYYGTKEKLLSTVECNDPVVHWIAENGDKMMISGTDENGKRNKLWLTDADYCGFIDLKAEDTAMSGTLVGVGYNAKTSTLILNVKEEDEYYIGALSLADNMYEPQYISIPFFTSARTSLLSFNGSTLYLAVADGSLTQIYAVDINTTESRIIKTYNNNPKISQNLAFTYGIISPSENAVTGNIEIFDPATETFISTGYFDESINFGASRNSFSTDSGVYTISNGTISSANGLKVTAPIDYKKSFSPFYYAYSSKGYVYITDSIYSMQNKNSSLNFSHITSSCNADFRETLNGAVGMMNALALNKCKEAGIIYQTTLRDALPVYYSKSAVKQLKEICSISDYGTVLKYTNGGLKAISAKDIELVISTSDDNTASGVAYIRAGSFAGKTAYRSMNVSFVREDGVWKLDTIIQ